MTIKDLIRAIIRPNVDPILLLDEHLHTKAYDINQAEPSIDINGGIYGN